MRHYKITKADRLRRRTPKLALLGAHRQYWNWRFDKTNSEPSLIKVNEHVLASTKLVRLCWRHVMRVCPVVYYTPKIVASSWSKRTTVHRFNRFWPQHSFLDLAAELRNTIYEYCLVTGPNPGLLDVTPALLQAHPQIRAEAMPVYLGANVFDLVVDISSIERLARWSKHKNSDGDTRKSHSRIILYFIGADGDGGVAALLLLDEFLWQLQRSGIPKDRFEIDYGHRDVSSLHGDTWEELWEWYVEKVYYATIVLKPLLEEYGFSFRQGLVQLLMRRERELGLDTGSNDKDQEYQDDLQHVYDYVAKKYGVDKLWVLSQYIYKIVDDLEHRANNSTSMLRWHDWHFEPCLVFDRDTPEHRRWHFPSVLPAEMSSKNAANKYMEMTGRYALLLAFYSRHAAELGLSSRYKFKSPSDRPWWSYS